MQKSDKLVFVDVVNRADFYMTKIFARTLKPIGLKPGTKGKAKVNVIGVINHPSDWLVVERKGKVAPRVHLLDDLR